MAKDRAKVMRRKTAFAKVETTTGTEQTLAAADYVECFDPDIKFDNTFTKRQGAGLGNRAGTPGEQSAAVTFKAELRNAASMPLSLALLTACGFKNTAGVFTLQGETDVGDTVTFGTYTDGRFKSAAGCMFNVKMTGEIGKPVMCEFSGKGKRSTGGAGPRDVTTPSPITPIAGLPPVVKGITLTVGGTSYCVSKFEIDFGNEVQLRPCATDATGFYSAQIVARNITIKLDPEAKSYTVKNWNTDYEAGSTAAVSIVIGSGTNGTITIAAAKCQLEMPPEDTEVNGILRDTISLQAIETAVDDEITITAA